MWTASLARDDDACDLKWANMATLPPGAMVAVIEGPLDQSVLFILRLRLPANYQIPAHWHPWIEHLTVISGTLHMGTGVGRNRRTSELPGESSDLARTVSDAIAGMLASSKMP